MSNIRHILRLRSQGQTISEIIIQTGINRATLKKHISDFKESGLTFSEINELNDTDLEELFTKPEKRFCKKIELLYTLFPSIEKELRQRGVTQRLLWKEYKAKYPDDHASRGQFNFHFKEWKGRIFPTMRQQHKAGDKLYIDFAGSGLLKCKECGSAITAQFAKGNGGTYRYYRCTKKKGKCSQSYLREDLMQNQLRELVQMVTLPEGWGHKMLAQVDAWQMEEQKSIIAFAQTVETKLKETEQRLDKLINAFLDDTIDKSAYLQKKDELVKLKLELIQKKADFGQKGKLWVEPLRGWLETLQNAERLNEKPDFTEIKTFLEKVGTNRFLQDKKVCMDWIAPYSFIPTYKGLAGANNLNVIENKTGSEVKNKTLPVWTSTKGANRKFSGRCRVACAPRKALGWLSWGTFFASFLWANKEMKVTLPFKEKESINFCKLAAYTFPYHD